ncbi:MAG: DUF2127 domain-containing protein [Actinobacteria bacterium]|nr:DUF2127 domain-containing protein [Actinomycetota bacterium]
MARRHWHLETFVCSIRGHCAPAATVARLRPVDRDLGFEEGGHRFARCLRCDAWVQAEPPAEPTSDVVPPEHLLDKPRRGRELRDAVVLRIISVDRALHSLVFGLLAIGLIVLDLKLGPLKSWANRLLRQVDAAVNNSGTASSQNFLSRQLHKLLGLHQGTLKILILTAVAYCVVEGVEAVGLWRERRWAEYLTALATAGFLPFEIHELTKRVTVFRIGALVVNVLILIYLVYAKRLFGIRGGKQADAQADLADA